MTFEDARIDEELPIGGKVSYTFEKVEEARYFCRFEAGMQGSIIVG